MVHSRLSATVILSALLYLSGISLALDGLNPAGEPRYGRHVLAPGFAPAAAFEALSGGDIQVKPLNLGDNCLGYAASDPDFIVELAAAFDRITFLVASEADTTLIINLPNGSWACNDDTNGLNPALVFHNASAGPYRIWVGSYAAETNDESVLHVSEAGPEALPTTATGPDPGRDPLYGETSLAPGFAPSPFSLQVVGGGRNRVADFITGAQCSGFVAEAPDFSVYLGDSFGDIWFAAYSPADMTLLVNAADGSWRCSDERLSAFPLVGFSFPQAGLYDVWIGSADEDNYAAAIFFVTEHEPDASLEFAIDTSCGGALGTSLQVGKRAVIMPAAGASLNLYATPETASTVVFQAPASSVLKLVGGPVCAEEQRWWRAELNGGIQAWVADGDAATHWLAPES